MSDITPYYPIEAPLLLPQRGMVGPAASKAVDDELTITDRMKVADDSWAHIAVQGPYVIVRDLRALKVYRWQ